MQLLEQTGVGVRVVAREIHDSTGTGLLPIQAEVQGAANFRVLGRVDPAAPWMEIVEPGPTGWINSIAWVPFLQLEVTSGVGTVRLWIGEK